MYEGNQNFDKDGWLVLGFNGHQPECADGYTSTGSLYMATLSFLPLGLPDGGQGRGGLGAGLLLRADRRRPHRRLPPRRQQRVCRGSDCITISTQKGALVVVETVPDGPILS